VQAEVGRYQATAFPQGVLSGSVRGADTVVVTGRRTVPLPVIHWLGVGAVTISASADASARQLSA
jgi:hypothetical protein